jgi:ABC-type uncharacterized transport system auxiliary subunit
VHAGRMRTRLAAAVALALSLSGCDRNSAPEQTQREKQPAAARKPKAARLVDLSASLQAARVAFNAQKGQARFLTLLSPT